MFENSEAISIGNMQSRLPLSNQFTLIMFVFVAERSQTKRGKPRNSLLRAYIISPISLVIIEA